MAFHHSPKIVTNGLVLYLDAANSLSYPGSGSVWYDVSGKNNHCNIQGSTTTATLGTARAMHLNSVGKYFTGTLPSSDQPATNATLESWIFPQTELSVGDMGTVILVSGGQSIYQSLYKATPPQLSNYWYGHLPKGYHIYGSSNRDRWHHWCSVWNFIDQKLYQFVDGVKVGTTTTYGNASCGPSINIGRESDDRQFSGGIAIIKIYTSALTDSQVIQNYNVMKGRFGL